MAIDTCTNNELLGYQGASNAFFDRLQMNYGATLEKIHIDDKLVMLAAIPAYHLIGEGGTMEDGWQSVDPDDDSSPVVREILSFLEGCDPDEQWAFAIALQHQVREQFKLQKSFKTQLVNAGVDSYLAEDVSQILAGGGIPNEAQQEQVFEAFEIIHNSEFRDQKLIGRIDSIMGLLTS